MADINEAFERMIAEMQRYGAAPAPSKGGSYNNMLRYRETREKILERFLAVFADGYRMGKDDDAPTITSSGWVSVEDRLPEESDDYLVCTEGTDMFICYYLKSENVWDMSDYPYITEKISHWMPLPELPEGVEL